MKNLEQPKQKPQAGFTLIELLVVIIIIVILAATALPSFLDGSKRTALKKLIDLTSAQEINLNTDQMNDMIGILGELSTGPSGKTCLTGNELGADPFFTALVSDEVPFPEIPQDKPLKTISP